uniref:Uncharacterized protein n=1 Tax=Arion vulgaris TaxID=1028688 RepID=A0A0B6Z4F1_9EUPU
MNQSIKTTTNAKIHKYFKCEQSINKMSLLENSMKKTLSVSTSETRRLHGHLHQHMSRIHGLPNNAEYGCVYVTQETRCVVCSMVDTSCGVCNMVSSTFQIHYLVNGRCDTIPGTQ